MNHLNTLARCSSLPSHTGLAILSTGLLSRGLKLNASKRIAG
jgi:hypothetical protein